MRTAVTLYVGVAVALLLRTLIGVVSVRRMIASARAIDSASLAALRDLAGHAALNIREGDLRVPVTAGFVEPMVILPTGWRAIPSDGLAAILRHEAAHVRRKDCLVSLGCAILEALAWFTPVVWVAGSRVGWFAEMACDSEAAGAMDGDRYASALLALAAGWSHARCPLATITAGAETGVGRRIRLLLDEMEQGCRRRALLPAAALLVVIALPRAGAVRVSGSLSPLQPEMWLPLAWLEDIEAAGIFSMFATFAQATSSTRC